MRKEVHATSIGYSSRPEQTNMAIKILASLMAKSSLAEDLSIQHHLVDAAHHCRIACTVHD